MTARPLEIKMFPCLFDNYGFLIHDAEANLTAAIDTPEVRPIQDALARQEWQLTHIINTHHHWDHGSKFQNNIPGPWPGILRHNPLRADHLMDYKCHY